MTTEADAAVASMRDPAEVEALRDVVVDFLAENVVPIGDGDPEGHVTGAVWKGLVDRVGVAGIGLRPSDGGLGGGAVAACAVVEELGRALDGSAYFAVELASTIDALVAPGHHERRDHWLAGRRLVAMGFEGLIGRPGITAVESGGRHLLTGATAPAIAVCEANDVVVVADGPEGAGLYLVDPAGPGVERRAAPMVDQTRSWGAVALTRAPAELLGPWTQGVAAAAADHARVLLAASQVGGARRCLELAVEYARTREQFDQPIGRFQSIKHLCAQVHVDIETSHTLVMLAARSLDGTGRGEVERSASASMALASASEAYRTAAATAIQIHGGIGFTWECEAHHHLKRSAVDGVLLGTPRQLYRALGEQLIRGDRTTGAVCLTTIHSHDRSDC